MVDPLEVMIAYLKSQLGDHVDDRVAAKHRFGGNWTPGTKCLVVRQDGGPPDLYAKIWVVRLELDFYGANTVEIAGLFAAIVAFTRSVNRLPVEITNNLALLHSFTQASGLSCPLYDPDLKMDYGMAFFNAIIAEEAVAA